MAHALTTSVTGDSGLFGVGLLVTHVLGWHFRPQEPADVGIDAQIEPVLEGVSSGRLLGVQVKAGPSWFREPATTGDGWVFREDGQTHRDYWLSYKLPVIVVLYDPERHAAYWQQITPDTAVVTGRGFKVTIPSRQRLDSSAHDVLAKLASEVPPDGLSEFLEQLPPSCANQLRQWDEINPTGARKLAIDLVSGRDRPAQSVQDAIVRCDSAQSWLAWMAVGEYAHEFGLPELAAECFLSADKAGGLSAPSSRLRAFAGILLSSSDPDRARNLLVECSTRAETRLLAAVGLAQLDHGDSTDPIPIPSEVESDPEGAAREPTVQWFLGDQRLRVGAWDAAVDHHRQALAHAPGSAKQRVALAKALLRRAGAGLITSAADYRDAAAHAEAARAEYRRWRGDSAPAAHVLMSARMLVADDASAFRVAQAPPDGEATDEEAASPQLAFTAAQIAYGRGDLARGDEFGAVVEASADQIWMSHLAAVRADANGADRAEREHAWRAVLAVEDDVSRRVVVCAHLATMGCWPVPELDELHAAGWLTPGSYETLHARALHAVGRTSQAIALLRGLRNNNMIAAEAYAQLLADLGQVEECVQACGQASARFGATHLDMLALDVLFRAGRSDEFIAHAIELLGRSDLPYRLRHSIRARLISEHGRRQAWATCEQIAQRGLREITQLQADLLGGRHDPLTVPVSAAADLAELRRQYAWMTIVNQFNQGNTDRAYNTLSAFDPDIYGTVEASLWFDLHQIRGWTPDTAEFAVSLAERPDLPRDLTGKILFGLAQALASTGDSALVKIHDRLSRAWNAYIHEHQPPDVHQIDATPQLVLERVRDALKASAADYVPVGAAVRTGQLPVGAVSTATSRPYLLGLTQLAAGLLPAVSSNPETNLMEAQSAAEALDGPVAVETSALYVAAGMLDLWSSIGPQFSDLQMAGPAVGDVLLSQVMAQGLTNVAGALGVDPGSGQMWFNELTDNARTAIVNQCVAVHNAAQTCHVIAIDTLDILGRDYPISRVGAWMGPLALAVERQLPLFSDDIALRNMARAAGIPAFGTLAVLDALIATGRWQPAVPDPVPTTMFNHQVVDLPQATQLILAAAEEQGPVTSPVLLNLARPALWQHHANQAVDLVNHLIGKVSSEDAHALALVVAASATGWAAAFTPADDVIARIAALALAYHTGITIDGARIVIPAIQTAAAEHGVNPMPHLRNHLIGILTDPTDRFQMTAEQAAEAIDDALTEFA